MGYKWAPEEYSDIDASMKVWGGAAEIILLEYYLKHVGRQTIFPHSMKDFADFTSGWANQTLYIAFIRMNNEKIPLSKILKMRRPGLVKVPDICTHDYPRRTEYYECKPDSVSGKRDGLNKLAEIDALNQEFELPYVPGKIWRPNIDHVLIDDVYSGQPYTCTMQFRTATNGLILWNMDYSSKVLVIPLEEYPEYLEKIMKHATNILADLVKKRVTRLLNTTGGEPVSASGITTPPDLLQYSVGRGGTNRRPEVKIAQILLNLASISGIQPLTVDGICGQKTVNAIDTYQRRFLTKRDALIEPRGPTIAHLVDDWYARMDSKFSLPELSLSAIADRETRRYSAIV